jgi:hypothetical protein
MNPAVRQSKKAKCSVTFLSAALRGYVICCVRETLLEVSSGPSCQLYQRSLTNVAPDYDTRRRDIRGRWRPAKIFAGAEETGCVRLTRI